MQHYMRAKKKNTHLEKRILSDYVRVDLEEGSNLTHQQAEVSSYFRCRLRLTSCAPCPCAPL